MVEALLQDRLGNAEGDGWWMLDVESVGAWRVWWSYVWEMRGPERSE